MVVLGVQDSWCRSYQFEKQKRLLWKDQFLNAQMLGKYFVWIVTCFYYFCFELIAFAHIGNGAQ